MGVAEYAEAHPDEAERSAMDFLAKSGRPLMDWKEFEAELSRMSPWDVFCAGFRAGRGGEFRWTDPYVCAGNGDFETVGKEGKEILCKFVWTNRGFAEAVFDGSVEATEGMSAAVKDEWRDA